MASGKVRGNELRSLAQFSRIEVSTVVSAIIAMASSSTACSASTQTVPSKTKQVHTLISDLLDLAIYSFGCQSGLRSYHKIRGDPVLEGVSALLGRMLLSSNAETQAAFDEMTPLRLGNWRPGGIPTKELLTLISSRIKNHKKKGIIRESKNPEVPSLVLEEEQIYSEEEDRVKYKYFPRCWRCSQRCQFCLKRKKFFPNVGNFTVEIASPFLDVLEEILEEDDTHQDGQEDDSEDMMESDEEEINDRNYRKCISGEDFTETDEEDGENQEGEDLEGNDSDVVEAMCEEDI